MILESTDQDSSLVSKIAAAIAHDITSGSVLPGDELNSVELAARFGSSRTPVREALLLLEREGLVINPPRRRPQVAHILVKDIEEIYAIREHLNELMIKEFIRHATAADLADMDGICQMLTAAEARCDLESFAELRIELFLLWEDRCRNSSLRTLLRSLKTRLSVRRLGTTYSDQLAQLLANNLALAGACRDRDPDLAGAMIRSMTRRGRDDVTALASRL